jgi:hypothetical protein
MPKIVVAKQPILIITATAKVVERNSLGKELNWPSFSFVHHRQAVTVTPNPST